MKRTTGSDWSCSFDSDSGYVSTVKLGCKGSSFLRAAQFFLRSRCAKPSLYKTYRRVIEYSENILQRGILESQVALHDKYLPSVDHSYRSKLQWAHTYFYWTVTSYLVWYLWSRVAISKHKYVSERWKQSLARAVANLWKPFQIKSLIRTRSVRQLSKLNAPLFTVTPLVKETIILLHWPWELPWWSFVAVQRALLQLIVDWADRSSTKCPGPTCSNWKYLNIFSVYLNKKNKILPPKV